MKYDEFRKLMRAATPAREIAEPSEPPMEPTVFERGAEWVNENVPVLPTVLGKLGEVGQIGLKAASAVPLALQGEGGQALGRLGQAALGVPQFFGIGGDPEYLDPGQVLTEMGVPEEGNLGRWDSPLGTFTGRGGLKFLLSVGTDPLMYTGAGLTTAGKAAMKGGTLATAPVSATGRVGSALAAQALAGQRSILNFAGRAVVPRKVSAAVLGAGEMGVRKLAQGPMAKLARFSGFPEVKKGAVVGGIEGGIEKIRAFKGEPGYTSEITGIKHPAAGGAERALAKAEEFAKAKGVPLDQVFDDLTFEIEEITNNAALRRQFLRNTAQAEKLEDAAAKSRAHVERTRSAVERDIDRDANSLMNEAGKVTLDAFNTAGRLGDLENAARTAGDTLKADAYRAAADRVVRAAVRRETAMIGAAADVEKSILGAAGKTEARILQAGRRIGDLARRTEARFKSAKLSPEVDKAIAEMNALAGKVSTADASTMLDEIAKLADNDLTEAQQIIDAAVRPGETALGRSGNTAASIARNLVAREQKRMARLVRIAGRMGDTRTAIHGQRLGKAAKLEATAADIRLTTPPPVLASQMGAAEKAAGLRWADEYRQQGYSNADAARAAVQRIRSPGLDPDMAPLAAMWDRVLRPLVREERRRGVVAATLSDPYLNWVSHSLTPEAAEFIAKNDLFANTLEAAWRRKFSARNASHMKRKAAYEGMPIRELEAEFKAKFPEYQGQFFNPDPMAMVAKRAAQTERSVSTAGLVRNVAEDFARPIPESGVPNGWVAMDNVTADSGHVIAEGFLKKMGLQTERISPRGAATPTSLGAMKGMMLPKEIAEAVIRRIEITRSPAARGAFMQTLVAATDSFKWLTTRLFPEFYVRNFNSDVFRNFEAGIVNPLRYVSAVRMLKDAAGTGERTWTLGGKVYTSKAIRDLMDAGGVYRTGKAAEVGAGIPSASRGFFAGTERVVRKGAGAVDNIVSSGDNITRATHFMAKLDEGLPVEDAILSVKKFLFDYKDLSPLERHAFRIAVPFYSWLRFNTPLMLESLVARPGKMAVVGHAMRALDDGEGEGMNTSGVPPWVQRRLYFTKKEEDGSETNISGFGLPFEDFAHFDGPHDKFALNVLSMLNPAIKFPIERATGIESFRGIPIKNDERANPILAGLAGIPGGKAFLDWLDFREVREGVYRADPEKLHLMTAPFLAGINRASGTIQRFFQDPEAAGIKLATGVRVNPISAQEQTIENMRQSVNLVIKQMEELQAQGITREIEDKFMIRRDVLPTDPRVLKAMRLQRKLTHARKLLGHLSDAQRFAGAQSSLRTGGAR